MTRQIDVDNLTDEQLAQAIQSISNIITKEVDKTVENANKLLNRYGLSCKMQIVIDETKNLTEARDTIKAN